MQDKVSIAATKEKVSNAAAKGGKAFVSLIQKARHAGEVHSLLSPKSPDGASEAKSPEVSSNLKPLEVLGDTKFLEVSSEPKSPGSLSGLKSPRAVSELKSPRAVSELKSPRAVSEPKPTGALSEVEGDSDEPSARSPKTSMERKAKFVNKLKRGLKGKKTTDVENRAELLHGNPHDPSPRVRSTDSIKAAYGHKPSTDPTSIAAQNREKLIERQEKLQAMNKQSEDMAEGAEGFASMAEELAKKIENRPWYKL